MTTYFVSTDLIDDDRGENNRVFPNIEEAMFYVKPGDTIEVLSNFKSGFITCRGKLKIPIIIRGDGHFETLHVKGQYLDITLNCDKIYLTDCIGISIFCCQLNYFHATNIAMITLYQITFDLIEAVRGCENIISNCTGRMIKLTSCSRSLITENTADYVSLVGDQPDYQLGTIKNNKVKDFNIINGVLDQQN